MQQAICRVLQNNPMALIVAHLHFCIVAQAQEIRARQVERCLAIDSHIKTGAVTTAGHNKHNR